MLISIHFKNIINTRLSRYIIASYFIIFFLTSKKVDAINSKGIQGGGMGFSLILEDEANSTLNNESLIVLHNNERIDSNITRLGKKTLIEFTSDVLLKQGSTNIVDLQYQSIEEQGVINHEKFYYKVPEYYIVPEDYALNKPDDSPEGFLCRVAQISDLQNTLGYSHLNTIKGVEEMLYHGLKDHKGLTYLNEADQSAFEIWSLPIFKVSDVINWEQRKKPEGLFKDDKLFPGIPGWNDSHDGFVIECLSLLELKKGSYKFGITTQDGHQLSFCHNPKDKFQFVISRNEEYESTSRQYTCDIVVTKDGFYPIRLLSWEKGNYNPDPGNKSTITNSANLEFYSIKGRIPQLINKPKQLGSVSALQHFYEFPYVSKSTVTPGMKNFPDNGIIEMIVNKSLQDISEQNIILKLNGEKINFSTSNLENEILISHTPQEKFSPNTAYNIELYYHVDNNEYFRQISVPFHISNIPSNALIVEAEDYNYEGGKWKTFEELSLFSNDKFYRGGAYAGLKSKLLVDYSDTGDWGYSYRNEEKNIGIIPSSDLNRGVYNMIEDYHVGKDIFIPNYPGEWRNYTRNFPDQPKYYKIFARMASSNPPMQIEYFDVLRGHKTYKQKTEKMGIIGSFNLPSNMLDWDKFDFYPLLDASGNQLSLKISGEYTFRITNLPGFHSLNYIIFKEDTKQTHVPYLAEKWPNLYIIEHKKPFMAYIKNRDTFVSSVKMFVNGKQVDAKIDKNDVGTRVSYLPDPFEPGEQVIKIVWLDNTGFSNKYEWKAKIPNFYFNHDRAPTNPAGYMNVFEYHNLQVLPQPIVLHTTNKYPDSPDESHKAFSIEWLPGAQPISNPSIHQWKDKSFFYATQMVGYIYPPETGDYTFYLSGNDGADLWLSTDEFPVNKILIATEPGWNGSRDYINSRGRKLTDIQSERYENVSKPINLEKGKPYFIEVNLSEWAGTENVAVSWKTPNGLEPVNGGAPISGKYLSPFIKTDNKNIFIADYFPKPDSYYKGWQRKYTHYPELEHIVTFDFININHNAEIDGIDNIHVTWNNKDMSKSLNSVKDGPYIKYNFPVSMQRYERNALVNLEWTSHDGSTESFSWSYEVNSSGYDLNNDSKIKKYFYIEAEDYDFESGRYIAFDKWKPGVYKNKAAKLNVDYYANNPTEFIYRQTNKTGSILLKTTDNVRKSISHTDDYVLSKKSHLEWYSYTRDFPSEGAVYDVYCRASYLPSQKWMDLNLSYFTENQDGKISEIKLGNFSGRSTASPNNFAFFPLVDVSGKQVSVWLKGEQKLKISGGDNEIINYLVFIQEDQILSNPSIIDVYPKGYIHNASTISAIFHSPNDWPPDISLILNNYEVPIKITSFNGTHLIEYYNSEGLSKITNAKLEWINFEKQKQSYEWNIYSYDISKSPPKTPLGYLSVQEFKIPPLEVNVDFYESSYDSTIQSLRNNPKFPNHPDSIINTFSFEWPFVNSNGDQSSTGQFREYYGWVINGYLYPPVTGDYIFYLASDDNGELWLSTDSTIHNIRKIASENNFSHSRDYSYIGDESVSEPIWLEKGEPYYIEALAKQRVGAASLAVAWKTPNSVAPTSGSLPIPGKYLSPRIQFENSVTPPIVDNDMPTLSIYRNESGDISLTWTGKLEVSSNIDGPWETVNAKSPLIINKKNIQLQSQFARAVKYKN